MCPIFITGLDYKKNPKFWSVILKSFWDFFNPLLRPPAWQAQDQIDPSQNDLGIALQSFFS